MTENNRATVLLTLLHLHALNGRVTMRQVAMGAGLSLTTTRQHLIYLAADGCVAWDEGTNGTLRPLVYEVWAA